MGYLSRFVEFLKRVAGAADKLSSNPQVRVAIQIVQDVARLQSATNEDKREYAVALVQKQLGVSESVARFLVEAAVQAIKQRAAKE